MHYLIWLCFGRRKREEQVEEKDHYTNEVIQQKREYVAMRRDMAIRSMVEVTPTDVTTRCLLLQMCMVGSILHALLSTNLVQPRAVERGRCARSLTLRRKTDPRRPIQLQSRCEQLN